MKNLGAYCGQDAILLGTGGGEVALVSTSEASDLGPPGSERNLGPFDPARLLDYVLAWRGRPFAVQTIEHEDTPRNAKLMGVMALLGAEVCQAHLIRGGIKKWGSERWDPESWKTTSKAAK
jgi:hypothetical protein